MPIGAAGAAVIAGAASLAGTGAQAYAQGRMNKKTIRFAREMQALQRKQALEDYHMQNDFNSPTAQMQRFRDAGLNPNLIYGQQNEGATVRSSDSPAWNPRAPQWDIGSGAQASLSAYYDVQLKEAQTDNLRATNTVLTQEAILKAVQSANIATQTERGKFDLGLAQDTRQYSLEMIKANLQKIGVDTNLAINRDKREEDRNIREGKVNESMLKEAVSRIALNTQNVLESISRVSNSTRQTDADVELKKYQVTQVKQAISSAISSQNLTQQQLQNLMQDSKLKELEINLKKIGLQPTDNKIFRVIQQWMSDSTSRKPTPKNLKEFWDREWPSYRNK